MDISALKALNAERRLRRAAVLVTDLDDGSARLVRENEHVDEFRSVHNLDALADLCASLDKKSAGSVDPRRWLDTGARRAA